MQVLTSSTPRFLIICDFPQVQIVSIRFENGMARTASNGRTALVATLLDIGILSGECEMAVIRFLSHIDDGLLMLNFIVSGQRGLIRRSPLPLNEQLFTLA